MFFKKSGLRRTGTDIEVLKREVKALHDRILMLECPHNQIDLVVEETLIRFAWTTYYGKKYCKSCGKTIEFYADKDSFLKARNKLMRELIALNEKEMKK